MYHTPERLKQAIWSASFRVGETETYASGRQGNNKLDIETCKNIYKVRQDLKFRLGAIAIKYKPEFITAVPNGANWLGRDVAHYAGLPFVELKKYDDGSIDIHCQREAVTAYQLGSCVVVEDVFNQFTNTRKTLAVPPIGDKARAVIGVWDRGDPVHRVALPLPVHSLIKEYIPADYRAV